MNKNKVEFGLTNLHVAFEVDGTPGTYGVPKRVYGVTSLSLSQDSEDLEFEADDNPTYYAEETSNGAEGDLSLATPPDWLFGLALGYKKDGKTGAIVEPKNVKKRKMALLFEGSGDANKVRRVYYGCTFGKPAEEFKTMGKQKEVKVTTFPTKIDGIDGQMSQKFYEDDEGYAEFFETAPAPSKEADLEPIEEETPTP